MRRYQTNPTQTTEAEIEAKASLLDFTTFTKPDYKVNWHHRVVCEHLDRFVAGDIKRLMIFAPPRSGKSELVSRRLPAYILGRSPDATIIATSYGADLARRMNRDVQRIIDTPEYAQLFPDTQLFGKNIRTTAHGSWLRNSDMFEVVNHTGYYMASGVGGSITGVGASVIIVDDPIKNRKEANSLTYRESVWEWYTSTLYTRLAPDGCILLTVTRWHEDDLAGRLLTAMKADPNADQWTVITLPAVAEDEPEPGDYDERQPGEPIWATRWDAAEMARKRAVVGERDWASLYQQHPAPDQGGILKRSSWRYWQPAGGHLPPVSVRISETEIREIEAVELPARFDEMLQSWDCTFKDASTSDFVAGQTWGRSGANKYLLDYVLKRMDITATMAAIVAMTERNPKAIAKLIEDKANGPAVIQMLHSKITGLIAVNPEGGKVSRAYAVQPEVEAGNVYLPHPMIAPWVVGFIVNCATFPNATHDDDVDAFTQALIRWQGRRVPASSMVDFADASED